MNFQELQNQYLEFVKRVREVSEKKWEIKNRLKKIDIELSKASKDRDTQQAQELVEEAGRIQTLLTVYERQEEALLNEEWITAEEIKKIVQELRQRNETELSELRIEIIEKIAPLSDLIGIYKKKAVSVNLECERIIKLALDSNVRFAPQDKIHYSVVQNFYGQILPSDLVSKLSKMIN